MHSVDRPATRSQDVLRIQLRLRTPYSMADAVSVSAALHHAIELDSDRFSLLLSVYGVILD